MANSWRCSNMYNVNLRVAIWCPKPGEVPASDADQAKAGWRQNMAPLALKVKARSGDRRRRLLAAKNYLSTQRHG